jgi:Bacterial mobilisation protein (MobC)
MTTATQILKTRVTPETKACVVAIAQRELLTEAVWLRRLEARALESQASSTPTLGGAERYTNGMTAARAQCSKDRGRASRLYVRVRREDRLLLHERAAARGMASATYLSVLLRSHLRALTPLPKDELGALKRAVGELGAIGRNLNQIARATNQGARVTGLGRDEFKDILKVCEALRDHTKDVIKVNTASWASGYAEDAP